MTQTLTALKIAAILLGCTGPRGGQRRGIEAEIIRSALIAEGVDILTLGYWDLNKLVAEVVR
jgi:hypothetical protein